MLRMDNSNVNFNGASIVEEQMVASMNASYSGDGMNVYFSFNVNNIEKYLENKAAVDADFVEFKEAVFATLTTII